MYNAISLFSGDKLGIVVATDVDFYTVILICTMLLVCLVETNWALL